jgi:hypothetical protein
MSKREDEAFDAWKNEIRSGLPEEVRAAWDTLANSDLTRERFFRGALRSEDYYRRLNEVTEKDRAVSARERELQAWYEAEAPKNEQLIAERDLLRAQVEEFGNEVPGASVSSEQLAELKAKADKVEQLDRILPDVMADMAAVTYDALKNGYEIDPRAVVRVSMQQGVTPYKAYEIMTAEARAKKYEAAREEERKKWVEEGRRQAISAGNGSPDHIRPSGPSVVDFLTRENATDSSQQSRVRAALTELESGSY